MKIKTVNPETYDVALIELDRSRHWFPEKSADNGKLITVNSRPHDSVPAFLAYRKATKAYEREYSDTIETSNDFAILERFFRKEIEDVEIRRREV
ncbi:MAG: hypothetical protein V3G42_14870 [Oscillospiraceae bacterium]